MGKPEFALRSYWTYGDNAPPKYVIVRRDKDNIWHDVAEFRDQQWAKDFLEMLNTQESKVGKVLRENPCLLAQMAEKARTKSNTAAGASNPTSDGSNFWDHYELKDAAFELQEAKAEIARHHRDFERIREVLDQVDEASLPGWVAPGIVRAIRNIVGMRCSRA